jgi:GLPGLI family protein
MFAFTCFTSSKAQQSGTITYTETMKMDIRREGGEQDELSALIPKEQKYDRVLYFTSETSLYQNVKTKKKDEDRTYEEGNQRMMIRMDVPDEQFYLDLAGQTLLQQKDVMGKKFLVESKTNASKWKLTGKQEEILNYPCQQAVMQEGDQQVLAWFTPAIPVGAGPHKFNSLPGLILKLVMDEGRIVIEANNIDLTSTPKEKIKKPKEGRKMTQEEFRAMMDERMKEMGADGDGNVIIKVRR